MHPFIKKAMILFILVACQTMAMEASTSTLSVLGDQQKLRQHFSQFGYSNQERNLVTLAHICTLTIANKSYPIVDLRELVKSPNSPRGVNNIFVLNQQLEKINVLSYTKARPLMCKSEKLYLSDSIELSEFSEPGNVLTFGQNGKVVKLENIDVGNWF